MNISSILDIIDGELQNSPSISFIYNIKTDPKKVIEGDLFLTKSHDEIEIAMQNGAFAIVCDFDVEVQDKEIAWIKVPSVHDALVKLFRFKFSTLSLDVYYCDKVTFDLINIYKSSKKEIKVISSNLLRSTKIIENINEDEIFFCSDEELIKKIYPNYKVFSTKEYSVDNLIEHSLFETSFSYEEKYFHKLKIPSLYIKQFLDVYTFLDTELDFHKLTRLSHFKPIFVDKYLNTIDFGKSNKFIICQKNLELLIDEIKYLEKKYKYGKTIFISPIHIVWLDESQIVLENLDELSQVIKKEHFNAIYIMGYDKVKIEETLKLSLHESLELF